MNKIFTSLLLLCISQSSFAVTEFSNMIRNAYSEEQELFTYDLSKMVATNLSTGVEFLDPVYRVRDGYNPNITGQVYTVPVGNYFGYKSAPGTANTSEIFNVLIHMKAGACETCDPSRSTLWPDITMNVETFSSLIQLLYVPSFNSTLFSDDTVTISIPSYDGVTGQYIEEDDLMYVTVVESGQYAPTKGTIVPHPSGRVDTFTYVANPGTSGWDTILVFTRHMNGKMGYNFFNIYNP